jgi:hypothetical protein
MNTRDVLAAARRFLRSPRTITSELLAVTLLAAAATGLPDSGDRGTWLAFAGRMPLLSALARLAGFHRVYGSWLFLAALLLAGASLLVVVKEQWDRAGRTLLRPLDERAFRGSPHRAEFLRPARGAPGVQFATSGRIGSLGPLVFHCGLVVVAVAGLVRALMVADAQIDLMEGETLPAGSSGFGAHWGGPLATPFDLGNPVMLERLRVDSYPSGELRSLSATVREVRSTGPATTEVGVNRPLAVEGGTLHVSSYFGPAAFLELDPEGGQGPSRQVVLLAPVDGPRFEKEVVLTGQALYLRLRARSGEGGALPRVVDARITRGAKVLYSGPLSPGTAVSLPGAGRITLAGLAWWVRISASRDRSVPLAYTGFAVLLLGALVMFGVVRVDTMVSVVAEGDQERVVVALRAERFAPLYRDRFSTLVRREGGESL